MVEMCKIFVKINFIVIYLKGLPARWDEMIQAVDACVFIIFIHNSC